VRSTFKNECVQIESAKETKNHLLFRQNGEEFRDEKRTLECLKKGAKIASQAQDLGVRVQLYVELLNHYLFYFERGNKQITVSMLNQVENEFTLLFARWRLTVNFLF
jgi:hypothetical protein